MGLDVDRFRVLMPVFASTTDYTDTYIQTWMAQAVLHHAPDGTRWKNRYELALYYYTAHVMTMVRKAQQEQEVADTLVDVITGTSATTTPVGLLSAQKTGTMSESYTDGSTSIASLQTGRVGSYSPRSPEEAELMETAYGRAYLRMIRVMGRVWVSRVPGTVPSASS